LQAVDSMPKNAPIKKKKKGAAAKKILQQLDFLDSKFTGGLESTVVVAVGMRVMVLKNLDVGNGTVFIALLCVQSLSRCAQFLI
jgi:hypothetical protein